MAFEVGSYVTVCRDHGRENEIANGEVLKVVASDSERMVVYVVGIEDPLSWSRFEEYPY